MTEKKSWAFSRRKPPKQQLLRGLIDRPDEVQPLIANR